MYSVTNLFRVTLTKLVALLYAVTAVLGIGMNYQDGLPVTPEDFTPVIRFAVCSDIHLSGDIQQTEAKRFVKLIEFMNDYSDRQAYQGFDALCVVGDFADSGTAAQYDVFNQIVADHVRPGTQVLTCIGNHELNSTGAAMYKEKRGELNTSVTINGYHFILCSYDEGAETFTGHLPWIDKQISAAIRDTGDKPVFVFQHPGPFASVYGSITWGDSSIPAVLEKYPQVIDFSGHSHYPINDPRSIAQSGFTALGTGTLSYFETDLDGKDGNFPYSYREAAQFYIVEADADGNVRILSYDLITDAFFDNEYYLTGLADRNFQYTYNKMRQRDKAPVFPEDTGISTYVDENGDTILTFTGAADRFVVESYKVSLSKAGIPVMSASFSGKYMYLFEPDVYTVDLGKLEAGKLYSVSVTAMNAYTELSKPLTYSFRA